MSVVLLIDDEPAMGSLVGVWLAEVGVEVTQVSKLEDALEAARRERPAAVLLDISLDGQDGLELLPRLKADETLRDVPFVGFSVHDSREAEARRLGASGFVRKPFRSGELIAAVKEHLP